MLLLFFPLACRALWAAQLAVWNDSSCIEDLGLGRCDESWWCFTHSLHSRGSQLLSLGSSTVPSGSLTLTRVSWKQNNTEGLVRLAHLHSCSSWGSLESPGLAGASGWASQMPVEVPPAPIAAPRCRITKQCDTLEETFDWTS